jgi:hypothetical protein
MSGVKRLAVAVVCALSVLAAVASGSSQAVSRPCGLPSASPLWVDYTDATVPFWKQVFARPGLVLATPPGTGGLPASLRAAGAATIFFDLKLASRVGTPDAPADPATITDRANKEFDAAVKQTGCATPLIAENELFGSTTQTPWSPGNAQYRANVLALLTQLTARGAHTYLLISSPPFGGDTAGDWWRAVAQVSDIVREFFPSAPEVSAAGPIAGSRTLRSQMRQAMAAFTSIGVPASRLGLMLEFESGIYGRNGIKAASDWFEYVKLDALAARQIAAELGLPTIWSWGWATYTEKSPFDADKQAAACVYLWMRSQDLCDGPAAAGSSFDSSLSEGQLSLPARVFCTLGSSGVIAAATRSQLTAVTRDADAAGAVALGWGATRAAAAITGAQTDAAERAVIDASFGGSRAAYLAALARSHANRGLARAAVASELRRTAVEAGLAVPPVSAASVGAFYAEYGAIRARLVTTKTPVAWLGGRTRGVALDGFAPARVFALPTGRPGSVQTAAGLVSVRALEAALPLGAVPPTLARPAIVAALTSLAKADAYEAWLLEQEQKVLATAVCAGDAVPPAVPVELQDYLPFLALP